MRKKSTSGSNETQKSVRQVAYQRGNQKEGSSPHYVFLYSDDEESENEEYPMKVSSTENRPRKIEVINVEIQSEDTLQALALRYGCSISELKRINKIHKDNEIHAHRIIKVPVQPFSLLTETSGELVKTDQPSASNLLINTEKDLDPKEDGNINALAIPTQLTSPSVEINNIILNSLVEPLSQSNSDLAQFTHDLETDGLINSIDSSRSNTSIDLVDSFKCSGADWGLSWHQVLCFSLLLGFAGPLIYVLYIAEHHNS